MVENKSLVKKFLRYAKTHRKVSKATLKVYESVLKAFAKYPLTEEGLEEFLESIEEQAPATQERKIVIIKAYLNFLYSRGYLKKRYWEDLRPPRRRYLPKWLTPSEAKRAINEAAPPYNYIFEFLYKTGLRIGELENLKPKDITQDDDYILKIKGKGNKERVLRVAKNVVDLLYKAGFPNLPSRRQIQKEAKRVSKIIGKKVTPHVFRHSFAVRLLAEGKPITLVKNLLGHSKLDTTAIYTNITSDSVTLS